MRSVLAIGLGLAAVAAGCAHAPPGRAKAQAQAAPREPRARAGTFDLDAAAFAGADGVTVLSLAADASIPLSRGASFRVRLAEDHVVAPDGGGGPTAGTPDVVSTASVPISPTGDRSEERFEGGVGLDVDGRSPEGTAVAAGLGVRAGVETDYRSLAASGGATLTSPDQSTTAALKVAGGYAESDPQQGMAVDPARWPAGNGRTSVGASVSRVVHRRVVLAAGASGTFQWGELASPYRGADVAGSVQAEVVPASRARAVAFLQAAVYLGRGVGLHLRPAAYADSWGVRALSPEGALAVEVGPRVLLTLRYRLFRQWGARFYALTFDRPAAEMSGDPRLGALLDHVPGATARIRLFREDAGFGEASLEAGYEVSLLRPLGVGSPLLPNHSFSAAFSARW